MTSPNSEQMKAVRLRYKEQGLCQHCGKFKPAEKRLTCEACLFSLVEYRRKRKEAQGATSSENKPQ